MPIRIAINGFGRIGRNILRSSWKRDDVEVVHINDRNETGMLAYLLHRDSVHGTWGNEIKHVDGGISIDGKFISASRTSDPLELPWADLGVDVVLECTGAFTQREGAALHLQAGARKVLISAPGKGVDCTLVYGVNHTAYDPDTHDVVSNASCTTNCLAPVVKALDEACGIEHGLVTTVHSYTLSQNLLDAPHRGGKFRRARAAAVNIVPTSTGAAKAIGVVMPEMAGKLNGLAIRVPTPNISLIDLVFRSERDTSKEAINEALSAAANGALAGVLEASNDELVSSDLVGNPHSSIADLSMTSVIDGRMVKVLSWYDNEWGFSNRMVDTACWIAQ